MNSKKYSLLLTLTLLMATLTFASAYLVVPASAQADDWPMFRHDPAHTGFSTSTAPAPFKMAWRYPTGGSIMSSPAVVDGKVYIGSEDTFVYCLDAATGSFVWRYETGGAVDSSPAVVDGKVYVGSIDNYVYCLDAASGNLVWRFETGRFVFSSPCVVDGKVYINSNDKNVYCLDAANGNLVWSYTTRGFNITGGIPGDMLASDYYSSPAVVDGKVYVGSFDSYVYCLDATTGQMIWEYKTGDAIFDSSPAVADGIVYIGSDDRYLYALDAATGSLVWRYIPPPPLYQWWVQTSPAVAYGKVYVPFADHRTTALDAETGAFVWAGVMGTMVRSSAGVADGKVYNGNHDRYLYCWDAETGTRLQSYDFAGAVDSSPAIADGKVYVGGGDSYVYCFEAGNPKVQNTVACMVQPRTVSLGESLFIQGAIATFHGLGPGGATVTLTYTRPDATTVVRTVTTYPDSAFDDWYTPDAVGSWSVQASWAGTENWEAATSPSEPFTVTAAVVKTSTTLDIGVVSDTSVPMGESVTVGGCITPTVIGAAVTLTYTKPDATTFTRTVWCEAGGAFYDAYMPDAKGSWSVKASFAGTETYTGSESTAASFSVTEAEEEAALPMEYVYLIVAIIVIVVALVAVYLFTRKK